MSVYPNVNLYPGYWFPGEVPVHGGGGQYPNDELFPGEWFPGGVILSQRAVDMLEQIPPMYHGDPDIRAAFWAMANELDRIDQALEAVINSYFPYLANDYLYLWEAMLGIGVSPGSSTIQRQQRVLAYLASRVNLSRSSNWVQVVTMLLGSGWSWRRYPDGGTPRNTIIITMPFAADSTKASDLRAILELITPANTEIVIDGGHGFIVQRSQIQEQPL